MQKHETHRSHIPIALGVCAIILITVLWQYSPEQRFTLFFVNKAVGTTAVFLISFSYLMGPLVKLIPPLRPHLLVRKYFGIFGFAFVILHAVTSLLQFTGRIPLKWYVDHIWGFIAGLVAAGIFLRLYLTSNDRSFLKLGKDAWKRIQRFGYAALLLTAVHVYFASSARWQMWWRGEVAMPQSFKTFSFIVFVLLIRLIWIGVDKLFPQPAKKDN